MVAEMVAVEAIVAAADSMTVVAENAVVATVVAATEEVATVVATVGVTAEAEEISAVTRVGRK
jgi:hypothetical protein